ncbi:MAG: radical SAM protein [bacterium]
MWESDVQSTMGSSHVRELKGIAPVRFMLVYLSEARDDTKIHEPLSITTLGGALKKEFADEIEFSLIHPLAEGRIPGIIKRIRLDKPNILGISLSFDTLDQLDEIMNFVNSIPVEERPMVLLGNILAKHNARMLLNKYPNIIICIGEGEYAVTDAVRYYRNEITKEEIRNVRYLDEKGGTVINPYDRVAFSKIGLPVRDLLPVVIQSGGIVHFETSRGCPHDCTMCSRKSFLDCDGKADAGWQGRRVEEIIRDLSNISREGARFINVVDEDLFGGGIERVESIADQIIKAKNNGAIAKNLTFFTSASVRAIYDASDTPENNRRKERVLRKLKNAGMTNFFMGVESGSPTQLERYGKAATVSENEEALNVVKRVGIRCVPGFIMFDPQVTKKELLENMGFLRRTETDRTITHALKTYFPMSGSMLMIDLISKELVDGASYKPGFTYYEYVYEHENVAHIHERIRAFEESQSSFSWLLKLVFRSSGFSELPLEERNVLIDMMEEQVLILVDYLEDLLKAPSEQEYPEIDRKFSNRLLIDMIFFLKELKHGQLHVDQQKFQSTIYEGIVREVIRTNFFDMPFSKDDIFRYIANQFAYGINLDAIAETLDSFEDEGRVCSIEQGIYTLTEDFWLYRRLPYYDLPRQAKSEATSFEPLRSVSRYIRPKRVVSKVSVPVKRKHSQVCIFDFVGTLIKENQNIINAASKVYYWIKTGQAGDVPQEAVIDLNTYLANKPWKYVGDHIIDLIQDLSAAERDNLEKVASLLLQRYFPQNQAMVRNEKDLSTSFITIYESILEEEYLHFHPELLPGAKTFLENLKQDGSLAFIVSGMPQKILEEITEKLEIRQYFTAIYGFSCEKQTFGHGKEAVFQEIITNHGTSTTPAIIIGNSPFDMEAAKSWARTSGHRCVPVGITEDFDQLKILFENGADFVMNRGYDADIFSYFLANEHHLQQGVSVDPGSATNVEDILHSIAPIVLLSAEKEKCINPPIKVDSQSLVFKPFISPVLDQIKAASCPHAIPEISSLENISQIYGLAKMALETDQIETFRTICEIIAKTSLLKAVERRTLLLTVFSCDKVLPFRWEPKSFFPYSFQSFVSILQQCWENSSKVDSLKIAQFGSGDGLMPFLDRMLAEAYFIKTEFKFFEINSNKIEKSLKYNPQVTHIKCDLRLLNDEYQNTFDVIYFNNVLHEVYGTYGPEGVIAVLRVAYRYLKDNGRIVLRDGISGDNMLDHVLLQSKTQKGRNLIETHLHFSPHISIFGTDHNMQYLMRYFDVVQILTKIRFSFDGNNRYSLDEEYRHIYNFATWEEYVRWFQEAGFSIQTVFRGVEEIELARWKELFRLKNPAVVLEKTGFVSQKDMFVPAIKLQKKMNSSL